MDVLSDLKSQMEKAKRNNCFNPISKSRKKFVFQKKITVIF